MTGPLEGIRVLELGSIIAGPFAGRLLADLGAEVLKVEPPSGDPLRTWGEVAPTGNSWWSYVQNRGKYLACVNLNVEEGRRVVERLLGHVDVFIENFRPGTIDRWGLGPDVIKERYPHLIYVALSGFGLTGPRASYPGFGNVAESIGGLRHVTGDPTGPPFRTGVSIGDTLASLYSVIGALASLYARQNDKERRGEVVDVALDEAVFSVMESTLTDYVHAGAVRGRTGNSLERAAPSGMYKSQDGRWLSIGGNSDRIFRSLCALMDRIDLAEDPRYVTNQARVMYRAELDDIINEWTSTHSLEQALEALESAAIPCGAVQSIADIVNDPQFIAREMFVEGSDSELGAITMPAPVPRLSTRPQNIRFTGGRIGRDTAVISRWLSMDTGEYIGLLQSGALVEACDSRDEVSAPR